MAGAKIIAEQTVTNSPFQLTQSTVHFNIMFIGCAREQKIRDSLNNHQSNLIGNTFQQAGEKTISLQ